MKAHDCHVIMTQLLPVALCGILPPMVPVPIDEDINPDTGMATPTEPAQAPPGPITRARARPITRARARELNFVMILKNEGPEVS